MIEIKDFRKDYDVIVSGGGMSGVVSAIASGRMGAKTLIVDRNGYFGGSLTEAGVGPMMTFFAGENQVIQGIGEEIIQRLKSKGYSPGHVLDTTNYISYVTPFSAEGMKLVLDELIQEANVDVLFHTYLIDVETSDDTINSVVVANKDGVIRIKSKIFVDATGDGDLSARANVPFKMGREEDGATQPMTMNLKVYNVDTDKIRQEALNNPDKYPRLYRDISVMKNTEILSFVGFNEEFKRAKAAGEINIPREDILFFETNNPGEFIMNTTRIINKNGVDATDITEAEMEGRKQCAELYDFLVKHIVGFENAKIALTGPSIGKRGTRQIEGVYTLQADDVSSGRKFESVIAHSGYPIDIHNPKGEGTTSVTKGVDEASLNKNFDRKVFDHYYDIPYEIMITPQYKNLLVTGRCVSASFEAQAAIRTTPTMTALGHACGVAAALAVASDNVHNVDIKAVQKHLIQQNAYLIV